MRTTSDIIDDLHIGRDIVKEYEKKGEEPPMYVFYRLIELSEELMEAWKAENDIDGTSD